MSPAEVLARPRLVAMICAATSVGLGLARMSAAGAPVRMLAVNAAALAIALMLLPALDAMLGERLRLRGIGLLALASAVVATAFLGTPVEGAARWVSLGSLVIQPGMIVLPLLVCAHARQADRASLGALVLVVMAAALQPDRALAGMALAGLAALAIAKPGNSMRSLFALSAVAFAVTLLRHDHQGAMPYVDQILLTAFEVHPLAGAAVWAGSAILLVPAFISMRGNMAARPVAYAFAAVWAAAILAALLGNYPTPLVGYSGSAVLGYVLSLSQLPVRKASCLSGDAAAQTRTRNDDPTVLPVAALA